VASHSGTVADSARRRTRAIRWKRGHRSNGLGTSSAQVTSFGSRLPYTCFLTCHNIRTVAIQRRHRTENMEIILLTIVDSAIDLSVRLRHGSQVISC
jgi:hypothetical protein